MTSYDPFASDPNRSDRPSGESDPQGSGTPDDPSTGQWDDFVTPDPSEAETTMGGSTMPEGFGSASPTFGTPSSFESPTFGTPAAPSSFESPTFGTPATPSSFGSSSPTFGMSSTPPGETSGSTVGGSSTPPPFGSGAQVYGTPETATPPPFGSGAQVYGTPETATPPAAPGNRNRNMILLGIGGAVLALCCACFVVLGALGVLGSRAGDALEELGIATPVASDTDGSDSETDAPVNSDSTSAFDLEVGDCFNDPAGLEEDLVDEVGVFSCDQPHDNEVYFLVDFPAGGGEPFPGESEIDEFANEECTAAFEPFVGLNYEASAFYVTYLQPTEETWEDGDREIVCFLYERDSNGNTVQVSGSARGSER